MLQALGLIETKGLIGAIEAADAMVKAADVRIINKEKSTAALVTIKIVGEVAAVKSAVEAGAAAAQRVGQLVSTHVIPRPDSSIDFLIEGNSLKSFPPQKKKISKEVEAEPEKTGFFNDEVQDETPVEHTELPSYEALNELNVHELRKLARGLDDFPIKGRDISKANRGELLDLLKKYY